MPKHFLTEGSRSDFDFILPLAAFAEFPADRRVLYAKIGPEISEGEIVAEEAAQSLVNMLESLINDERLTASEKIQRVRELAAAS